MSWLIKLVGIVAAAATTGAKIANVSKTSLAQLTSKENIANDYIKSNESMSAKKLSQREKLSNLDRMTREYVAEHQEASKEKRQLQSHLHDYDYFDYRFRRKK
jgi:hypothetical protein